MITPAISLRTSREIVELAAQHLSKKIIIRRQPNKRWAIVLYLPEAGEAFGLSSATDPGVLRLFSTVGDSINAARYVSGLNSIYFER